MAKSKQAYKISDLFITSWSDKLGQPTLTTEQMAALVDYRYRLDDAITRQDAQAEGHWSIMILRLLRVNKSVVSRITVEQVVDCINDITFIRDPWYFFPPVDNSMWSAPDEYMHDRTIEQLCYADSAFTKFQVLEHELRNAHPPQDGGPLSEFEIEELISVLYTKAEDFDSRYIADRAKLVRTLPFTVKAVVLHTYANIRDYIVDRYPNLFPKSEADASSSRAPIYSGPKWRDLLFDFAETEAFKGFDRARSTMIYTALDYLEKKTIDAAEFKRKLDRGK
jgi:hypothetical protein